MGRRAKGEGERTSSRLYTEKGAQCRARTHDPEMKSIVRPLTDWAAQVSQSVFISISPQAYKHFQNKYRDKSFSKQTSSWGSRGQLLLHWTPSMPGRKIRLWKWASMVPKNPEGNKNEWRRKYWVRQKRIELVEENYLYEKTIGNFQSWHSIMSQNSVFPSLERAKS